MDFETTLHKLNLGQKDLSYRTAVYAALCNVGWKNDEENAFTCSWRYAGGLVAEVADLDEYYLDYYCAGNEGTVDEKVQKDLAKLGWKPCDVLEAWAIQEPQRRPSLLNEQRLFKWAEQKGIKLYLHSWDAQKNKTISGTDKLGKEVAFVIKEDGVVIDNHQKTIFEAPPANAKFDQAF